MVGGKWTGYRIQIVASRDWREGSNGITKQKWEDKVSDTKNTIHSMCNSIDHIFNSIKTQKI